MVAEEIARQVAGCMPKKGRRGSGLGSRRKRTDTGTRERSKDWKPELPESKRARAPKMMFLCTVCMIAVCGKSGQRVAPRGR